MRIQGYPEPGPGLRLHLNENTGGCSPAVLDAIRRLDAMQLATYPSYTRLVTRCARHFDVPAEWILAVNGLDEGIQLTALGHVGRGTRDEAEAIVPLPAFDPYLHAIRAVGATSVCVPPGERFAFSLDATMRAITPRTRLVVLNTPNNPTGQLIAPDDIARICLAAPAAIVLIDEAYIEFGGVSFVSRVKSHPNALVGRTFSKAYGLAGMRVGVLIGQPPALDAVRAVTLPFNVNIVATTAALAALDDRDFLTGYAGDVRRSRERIYAACRRLGLEHWESAGNFVLVRIGARAAALVQALAALGIHVRDRSSDRHTPGCVRITAGITTHTDAVVEALTTTLHESARSTR